MKGEEAKYLLEQPRTGASINEDSGAKSDGAPAKGKSFIAAYAFTVNFIFGAGVLGIPNAFLSAGLLLSAIFLLFITFVCIITLTWLVEVQGRLESVTAYETNVAHYGPGHNMPMPTFAVAEDRKFETNELCAAFLGPIGRRLFEAALVFYSWGSLWLYTSIFASSFALVIGIPGLSKAGECDIQRASSLTVDCHHAYMIFVAIWFVVMVILVCFNLKEQAVVQMTCTILAYVAIIVMVTTSIINITEHGIQKDIKLFDFSGFGIMFSTCIFAQLCHLGAPTLTHIVDKKENAGKMFIMGLTSTAFLYMSLAFATVFSLGSNIESVITLNWLSYPDLALSGDSTEKLSALSYIIKYLVVLYPAVSVGAAFPLYATNLGDNIYVAIYPEKGSRVINVVCRWVMMAVPITCAMFLPKVKLILQLSGLCGFIVAFYIPGLLQWYSIDKSEKLWKRSKTPYSTIFSGKSSIVAVFVIATAAFLFNLFELIFPDALN